MKQKIKMILSIVAFLSCLCIMYGTDVGIPGITRYWSDFKLLDMQYFYSEASVKNMLQMIGTEGIQHYLYYFMVDICFIVALGNVQILLSRKVSVNRKKIETVLITVVAIRAALDCVEDFLLTLVFREVITTRIIPVCSLITTTKLIMMVVWICLTGMVAIANIAICSTRK